MISREWVQVGGRRLLRIRWTDDTGEWEEVDLDVTAMLLGPLLLHAFHRYRQLATGAMGRSSDVAGPARITVGSPASADRPEDPFVSSQSCVAVSAVNIAQAAETAVGVSAGPPIADPSGQGTMVYGVFNFVSGAAATSVSIKCYQGNGLGGTQVGPTVVHKLAAAAAAENIPYDFLDPTVNDAGVYTVSLTQTGAGGAGTVNYGTLKTAPASSVAG